MTHALDPSLAGSCKATSLDAFLELQGTRGEVDVNSDRALYHCGGGAPHVVADRLPSSFVVRRECCRFPETVVWADDEELCLVISTGEADEGMRVASRTTAELWSSEQGYHDRLDELAPVAVLS